MEPEVLLSDLVVGESPRWHQGRLWFSNWGAQEVIAVDPQGHREVVARVPTTLPFSIDWLPDGRLLIVSGPEGLLLRQEPDGSLETHADLSVLSDKPWNEIVVDGRGNAYVNCIRFDLMSGEEFAPGIAAVVTPDGKVRQVADGLEFPNGMVVTPDNATLIVAESYASRLTAFDIAADGSLLNRRVWAELGGDPPDGICLDAEGDVWCGAMNRCVRVAEGGEVLETIELDRACFACMLGGDDGRTLFMMAAEWRGTEGMTEGPRTGRVLTARAPAAGAGRP
jgi:sugar lactone lactonase YvrE